MKRFSCLAVVGAGSEIAARFSLVRLVLFAEWSPGLLFCSLNAHVIQRIGQRLVGLT